MYPEVRCYLFVDVTVNKMIFFTSNKNVMFSLDALSINSSL